MKRRSLNVLVVDDSAVVRQVMTAVLSRARDIKVTAAADPLIAISKMRQARPDVILLDLEMPRMDGLTFLQRIMSEDPIPVVVCSGRAGRGSDAALRALEQGAVEIVAKPEFGVGGFIEEKAATFIEAVRGAAAAKLRGRTTPAKIDRIQTGELRNLLPLSTPGKNGSVQVIAIGASTGGTEAIRALLEAMPAESPPVLIVQHMPEGYTAAFAKRLNKTCRLDVREAVDGDLLMPGRAFIAPGNQHMVLMRRGSQFAVEIISGPLVSRHRPSVDALFRSVARYAGPGAVGVLLTGMGNDGADGLLDMKRSGAATIAQDEATSVVFGMPKEAIALGAAGEVLPLSLIPRAILNHTHVNQTRSRNILLSLL
ncbi:MAG TPA: chemotaxis response regulator protein-glutamate methylesterase [Blastocatellia bacterium]|nr:chemotaxis response regulator protein-glutamate methylesterase [Blastocatellia bacterium]